MVVTFQFYAEMVAKLGERIGILTKNGQHEGKVLSVSKEDVILVVGVDETTLQPITRSVWLDQITDIYKV